MTLIPPAQIFVGASSALIDAALVYCQTLFCAHQGCGSCLTCRQIREQQFHATTWLSPEKQYSLDDLEPIFTTSGYALGENQHHFFIIQHAELLTIACSNSLLKIMEEPPAGYHFILLTSRLHTLLPTIRSRCIVKTIGPSQEHDNFSELAACFKQSSLASASAFLKILETEKPHEQETITLLDDLLLFWVEQHNIAISLKNKEGQAQALGILNILQNALQQPLMPGSSKIFWRNLYVQFDQFL